MAKGFTCLSIQMAHDGGDSSRGFSLLVASREIPLTLLKIVTLAITSNHAKVLEQLVEHGETSDGSCERPSEKGWLLCCVKRRESAFASALMNQLSTSEIHVVLNRGTRRTGDLFSADPT